MALREPPAPARAGTWPQPVAAPAPLPGSFGLRLAWAGVVRDWVQAEIEAGRLVHWVPVGFGAGIAVYFAADHEPMALAAVVAAAALVGLGVALRRHAAFPLAVMAAAVAAGFAMAAMKTRLVAHAVLTRPLGAVALKGFVETFEEREKSDRFVLRVTDMTGPRQDVRLARVRLSVRKGTAPPVGAFVELTARLSPPLAPLRPGSYDFGRDLYFQGIAASGFVTGAVRVSEPPASGGVWLRYAAALQAMRNAVDARIRAVVAGDSRAIATALLTGRRDAITTPVNDAMFISGLGHVLSISGYHMAVVAGVVFFAVRALLALVPVFTVRFAIKKWAAAAALAAATFYLLLSGSEVATQRSYLMTAVVLVAVLVDRRAITFRTLAIAALAVLAIAPEALVHPSFQMSYAATLGLVALVAYGMPRLLAQADSSAVGRAALWGVREIVMLALASTVAGLATTPYAAFHFHRVTPYGVLANLAAMPVVSALVMPAGMLGLVAMPFGLDGIFWRLMDVGIVWMIAVSQWVAALPGAIGRVPAFGTGPLLAVTAGMISFCLLRTPLRWAGAAAMLGAVVWAAATPPPDILVSADGRHVAVRGEDGLLQVMQAGKDAFLLKEWLAADADARPVAEPSLSERVSCDDAGCVAALRGGGLVAMAERPDAFDDDCTHAAFIVAPAPPPPGCAALVVDRLRLRRLGALAVRRRGAGLVIEAQRPDGTDRPWAPAPPEEGGAVLDSGAGRSRDATPPDPQAED
ncbi:MAG: ComEC/Rec2 family competence protein [Xanthobacteraceae bacterium]|nr:ComEC/Rec2 family competence protein [Xanthobacteraceae bacterium]